MIRTEAFTKLIGALSALPRVSAIGQSGSGSLPVANESDVDVFLYCDGIPHRGRACGGAATPR